MKTVLLFVGLVLCSAAVASAQEGGRLLPRTLLLQVAPARGSSFTPADVLLVERSLDQRIQEADPSLIVVESTADSEAGSDEAMRKLAQDGGADGWVSVSLQGEWTSARLKIRAFDLISGSAVSDLTVSRTGWSSSGSLAQEAWADVVPAIAGKFPMVLSGEAAAAGPPLSRLTVHARPGSVITGLGIPPIRIDSSGTAERMLPPFREYALRATLQGYLPASERLFLSEDRVVTLKQEAASKRSLELSLTDARAPGIDVTVQVPDPAVFVRLGVTTYVVGLALSETQVLLSDPLTVVALQLGMYLSPEDRFLRPYLGIGAFMRIVHASGWPIAVDALSPLGLRLVAGVEVPISAQGRVYLEYTPTLYYTAVPDAFHAALGTSDTPGWWFGPTSAVTVFSFRIGYRWPL